MSFRSASSWYSWFFSLFNCLFAYFQWWLSSFFQDTEFHHSWVVQCLNRQDRFFNFVGRTGKTSNWSRCTNHKSSSSCFWCILGTFRIFCKSWTWIFPTTCGTWSSNLYSCITISWIMGWDPWCGLFPSIPERFALLVMRLSSESITMLLICSPFR